MPSLLTKCCSSLWGRGRGTFLPSFLHSLVLPKLLTIVRATLLSQSKDQNSSHVSREQMSYHLGWCEHRYNADRKLKQSLGEPIMGWAVGAGLQTVFFFLFFFFGRTTLRCMINFLANSTQAARSLPSFVGGRVGEFWYGPEFKTTHFAQNTFSCFVFFLILRTNYRPFDCWINRQPDYIALFFI